MNMDAGRNHGGYVCTSFRFLFHPNRLTSDMFLGGVHAMHQGGDGVKGEERARGGGGVGRGQGWWRRGELGVKRAWRRRQGGWRRGQGGSRGVGRGQRGAPSGASRAPPPGAGGDPSRGPPPPRRRPATTPVSGVAAWSPPRPPFPPPGSRKNGPRAIKNEPFFVKNRQSTPLRMTWLRKVINI